MMKSAIFLLKSGNPILTCTSPIPTLIPHPDDSQHHPHHPKLQYDMSKPKKNTQPQHTSKITWAQAIAIPSHSHAVLDLRVILLRWFSTSEPFSGSMATKDWPTSAVPSGRAQGQSVKSEILGAHGGPG